MPYKIYEEQMGSGEREHPFNYMPDDVVFRNPWLMGDDEPPLSVLFPIVRKNELGEDVVDPLSIYIGTTRRGKPFAYNPRYVVNPLVLIVGTPGAGKSATVKTFIKRFVDNEVFMEKGRKMPPIIVVDPEGEYNELMDVMDPKDVLHIVLGRRDFINVLERPSKSIYPQAWYMRMLSVVQKFLNISPAQAAQAYRVLKRAIIDLAEKNRGFTTNPETWLRDDITLEDVYRWLENRIEELEKKGKMTRADTLFYQGAQTLYSRLDGWMYPPNDAFSRRSSFPLTKMLNYRLVILNARGLSSQLYGLFTYWITYWIYGLMLERGPLPSFGIRVVLAIDEAWSLLQKQEGEKHEENPLEALARRGRKYGILIIVATQTPEDVDEKMFSLFGTLVTGITPSNKMVEKVVESRGMPERFKQILKTVGQGELVWSINWRSRDFPMSAEPIVVRTDYPLSYERIQVEFG